MLSVREMMRDAARAQMLREQEAAHNRALASLDQQLTSLTSQFESSDQRLKQRHKTIEDMHVKIAEQAVNAITSVRELAASQEAQGDQAQAYLNKIPALVDDLRIRLGSLEAIDVKGLDQTVSQLKASLEHTDQTAELMQQSADNAEAISERIANTAGAIESHTQNYLTTVGDAFDALKTAHISLSDATSQMTQARDQVDEFVASGRSALAKSIKGVVVSTQDIRRGIRDFKEKLERVQNTTATFETETQAVVGGLSSNMEHIVDAITDQWHSAVTQATTQTEAVLHDISGDVRALAENHQATVKAELQALTEFSDVIHRARQATEVISQSLHGFNDQTTAAQAQFDDQLKAQQIMIDELRETVDPIKTSFENFATLDPSQFNHAINITESLSDTVATTLSALREQLASMADPSENKAQLGALSTQMAQLHELCQGLQQQFQDSVQTTRADTLDDSKAQARHKILYEQLSQLSASLTSVEDQQQSLSTKRDLSQVGESLRKTLDERLNQGLSELSQQVHTVHTRLDDHQVEAPDLSSVLEQMASATEQLASRVEISVTSLLDKQSHSLADADLNQKSVTVQLRKIGHDLHQQYKNLDESLKNLRGNQIQVLKQNIRRLPDTIVKELTPALSEQTKGLEQRLDELGQTVRTTLPSVASPADIMSSPGDEMTDEVAVPSEQTAVSNANPIAAMPDTTNEAGSTPQPSDIFSLNDRLTSALKSIDDIEVEITGLATAALAAPDCAATSDDFRQALTRADETLNIWADKLGNIATAIAIAQDAA